MVTIIGLSNNKKQFKASIKDRSSVALQLLHSAEKMIQ